MRKKEQIALRFASSKLYFLFMKSSELYETNKPNTETTRCTIILLQQNDTGLVVPSAAIATPKVTDKQYRIRCK